MADQEPSASTSSVPGSAEGADINVEAMKLLGTGKRHMVMEDYAAAVNAFQDACRLLSTTHGEIAEECGEAYFCYGKALLELARMERGVLGNALQGVPEDDDDDDEEETAAGEDSKIENPEDLDEKEKEELREQVYAALAEERDKPDEASADWDVVHEEKHLTKTPSKEAKVNSPTGELCATGNETLTRIELLVEQGGEDINEPMDEVVDCHPENGDVGQEGKGEQHVSIPEDVKNHLESQGSTGKDYSKTEDAGKDYPKTRDADYLKTEDAGEKVTLEAVEVGKKTEGKVALPLQDSLEDHNKESNTEEEPEIMKGDESDENGKPSNGNKITEKTEDGVVGTEERMEEGEDDSNAVDGDDDENEGTAEKDAESEEVDNLQLAWEMLELAKVIFQRQESKKIQLCAAQAYLKLGEVGIESENYMQAIEDFRECLSIQAKHLEPHNRLLAETHYQLGLAYNFDNQYDLSLKHFKDSFSVIEKRLALLTEQIDKTEEKGKSPAKDTDAVSEDKQEIEELKELLPEIKAKIEDAEESKDGRATKALQETLSRPAAFSGFETQNLASSVSAVQAGKVDEASTSTSNCVSNISHLIRKKSSLQRKPEDGERDNKEPKKAKQEESAVNGGCGDTAHDRNGVAEKMESEENVSPKKS
ncbi:nuclear autoantigenic sperm protein isoform X2 [Scyliorhinus canicula]|uniref:nuclear autoantigenic sperm protein isoform X2 n=1 Tax=Scyliorhinus canicula TaxID=7830 RepID=UPI0018F3D2A3|nr:nuclear autoantigenic sperm protein isoform X2 [Scyliorhinus canicula]